MTYRAYLCKINSEKTQVIIYGQINKISKKILNSNKLSILYRGSGPLKNLVIVGKQKTINKLLNKLN